MSLASDAERTDMRRYSRRDRGRLRIGNRRKRRVVAVRKEYYKIKECVVLIANCLIEMI